MSSKFDLGFCRAHGNVCGCGGRFRFMPKSYVGYLAYVVPVSTAHLSLLKPSISANCSELRPPRIFRTQEVDGSSRARSTRRVTWAASSRAEPRGQCFVQAGVRAVAHPGHVAIGPDENGGGRRHLTQNRKLPNPVVFGVERKHSV